MRLRRFAVSLIVLAISAAALPLSAAQMEGSIGLLDAGYFQLTSGHTFLVSAKIPVTINGAASSYSSLAIGMKAVVDYGPCATKTVHPCATGIVATTATAKDSTPQVNGPIGQKYPAYFVVGKAANFNVSPSTVFTLNGRSTKKDGTPFYYENILVGDWAVVTYVICNSKNGYPCATRVDATR